MPASNQGMGYHFNVIPHPERAATPQEVAQARYMNAVHPNLTFWTPAQSEAAAKSYRQSNPLGMLGAKVGNWLQLKQIAQDFAHSVDPRTPQGMLGLASMFFPGKSAHDLLNTKMPGQFEAYSLPKAQGTGQVVFKEGQTYDFQNVRNSLRGLINRRLNPEAHDNLPHMQSEIADRSLSAFQELHDRLFGGEVHATGPIPPRPKTMPKNGLPVPPPWWTDEAGAWPTNHLPSSSADAAEARMLYGKEPGTLDPEFDSFANRIHAQKKAEAQRGAVERRLEQLFDAHGISHGLVNQIFQANLLKRNPQLREGLGSLGEMIWNTNEFRAANEAGYLNPYDAAREPGIRRGNYNAAQEKIFGRYEDQMGPPHNPIEGLKMSPSAKRQSALENLLAQYRQFFNLN